MATAKTDQKTEGKGELQVLYTAQDGSEIRLTPGMMQRYVVSGKRELVNQDELIYCMKECEARGMNPFKKDCYIVKYTKDDPAAIIVSIHFKRAVARAERDCRGWRCGVIVEDGQGNLIEQEGTFVSPKQTLLGGWFEAQPEGWAVPFKHTVNLDKWKKNTQFWKDEAYMITKVAEAQGLSKVWPVALRNLVTEEEFIEPDFHHVEDERFPAMPQDASSQQPESTKPTDTGKPKEEPRDTKLKESEQPKEPEVQEPEAKSTNPSDSDQSGFQLEPEEDNVPPPPEDQADDWKARCDLMKEKIDEMKTQDDVKALSTQVRDFCTLLGNNKQVDLWRDLHTYWTRGKERVSAQF